MLEIILGNSGALEGSYGRIAGMAELYSRPLSDKAKEKLIAFLDAYVQSLKTEAVEPKASVAKMRAIQALQTDIDILFFIDTIQIFHSQQCLELVRRSFDGRMSSSREIAESIVKISVEAHAIDKKRRMADYQ